MRHNAKGAIPLVATAVTTAKLDSGMEAIWAGLNTTKRSDLLLAAELLLKGSRASA